LCGTALCGTVYLLAVRRCLLAVPQTVAPRPACARQNCARHRRGRFRPRLNPFVGRGKATRFRSLGDSRPDRVQIHVHAARQHGRFVQKALALEAALPKTSRAAVLPVRAPCNRLRQTTHQPGDARQPLPTFLQPFTVRHQHLQFVRLRFSRFVVLGPAPGEQIPPAACHVLVATLARDVRPVSDHQVNVVAHDGHRADVDGELSGKKR